MPAPARPGRALLALEDGTCLAGQGFGAAGEAAGEVVFNTAMTGYQEVLTDPSYHGQLVVMTYPHIGNYGVNRADAESDRPHVRGFVAREFARLASSHRAEMSLADYMHQQGIVGIHQVDTRALTRLLREKGSLRGVIAAGPGVDAAADGPRLVEAARALPDLSSVDAVAAVTTARGYDWASEGGGPGRPAPWGNSGGTAAATGGLASHASHAGHARVAVLDFGVKRNILRSMAAHGLGLRVLPATTPAEEVLEGKPDGVFLSNGPGDPRRAPYAIETIRALIGQVPVFGICLGHQLIALATGAETYKLKFGHHGGNHPVQHLASGRIEITTQNHNYAVDAGSAEKQGFVPSHRNLYDGTLEGMRHRDQPLFSVQYHPEAAPGPHDSSYLWDEFLDLMGKPRK